MLNLLFVARVAPHKGLPDLLWALALLNRADWRLVVVGGAHPTEADEVAAALCRLRVAPIITPSVRHARIPEVMRNADIVVVPSRYENFCNTVLEAMAAGKAVIGTQCGGIPDQIRDGWNGLLVPPGSPRHLADAIAYLLDHPAEARRFGMRSRDLAARFDWAVIARRHVELIESLLC